jgi:hypothetical protein
MHSDVKDETGEAASRTEVQLGNSFFFFILHNSVSALDKITYFYHTFMRSSYNKPHRAVLAPILPHLTGVVLN